MLKLQLEEDKELQKDIKQRDSLFILLEKMVGNAIIFTLVNSTYIFIFCCLIWVSKVIFSIDCNISQVRDSDYITYDMLENNFPFTILRNSYRAVYENKKKKQQKIENEIQKMIENRLGKGLWYGSGHWDLDLCNGTIFTC